MEYEKIVIKPGEDISEVVGVRKEIFGYGEDDLDEISISILFKGKDSGEYIAYGRIALDMESDRLIVDHVGVREPYRHSGYGKEMLDELTGIAKNSEAGELWAKSRGKEAAIAFLQKNGFEELNYFWMTKDI